MKMEKAWIAKASSHPSVEKMVLSFWQQGMKRTPWHLFLSEDLGVIVGLARPKRESLYIMLSQKSRKQYSLSSQELSEPSLCRIRYIILCNRMGLKNEALQRKSVQYGKLIWGYCSTGSTQRSPVLAPLWALTPAAQHQSEVLVQRLEGNTSTEVQAPGWTSLGTVVSVPTSSSSKAALSSGENLAASWGFPHVTPYSVGRCGERTGGNLAVYWPPAQWGLCFLQVWWPALLETPDELAFHFVMRRGGNRQFNKILLLKLPLLWK